MTFNFFIHLLQAKKARILLICLWLIPLIGCANLTGTTSESHKTSLQNRLVALAPSVNTAEAKILADFSMQRASDLAQQYRAVRPPWLHNVLVNHGFKERGLCFEWSNDLYLSLLDLRLTTLNIHLVVSKMDTRREHNSIVVTPHGHSITNGIVLDAWRGSGRLWFGPVVGDKYDWELLPEDRINPKIKKRLIEVNPLYSDTKSPAASQALHYGPHLAGSKIPFIN